MEAVEACGGLAPIVSHCENGAHYLGWFQHGFEFPSCGGSAEIPRPPLPQSACFVGDLQSVLTSASDPAKERRLLCSAIVLPGRIGPLPIVDCVSEGTLPSFEVAMHRCYARGYGLGDNSFAGGGSGIALGEWRCVLRHT